MADQDHLHLCQTPIDEQFDPGNKTAVIRGEEQHRFGNFIRCTHAAHRRFIQHMHLELLGLLLRVPYVVPERRVDHAWADGVDTDTATFQVERPGARERSHGSLGSAEDADSFPCAVEAATPALRMTELPLCKCGSAFCTVKRTPFTSELKVLLNCSSEISPNGATSPPPALAKSTSTRPCCRLTRSYKRSRSARFETSPCTAVTCLPICCTALSSSRCRRPVM